MTDTPPTQAASQSYFRALEEILARAGEGADVSDALALLPPHLHHEALTILQAQDLVATGWTPRQSTPPAAFADRSKARLVAGRYEVLGELGRGGMGVVYKARTPEGEFVVIKALSQERVWTPRVLSRFQREGESLKKIHRHPHLVHVLSSGKDPTYGPFLVLEFVEGVPLQRVIRERGRLDAEHAACWTAELANGLAVVHRHGLLHRDIKPANVIITPTGKAKLVDFGLAKDLFRSSMTKTGQMLGTSSYMAPEQWGVEDTGGRADERCDVFGLGATLYHMLVGRPPFLGESLAEVRDACLSGGYDLPSELVDGVPPQLEDVLIQMLMPKRRFRHFRMANVAADLERILAGQPSQVPCLVERRTGARHPLLRAKRWTLGRESSCQIHLPDASVSRRHAQLRREATGYVLRDLDSSQGTTVSGERITEARVLVDGDVIHLGEVELSFADANAAPQPPAILRDVVRRQQTAPVLHQLETMGDPRVALRLLERATAEPESERRWLAELGQHLDSPGVEVAARSQEHSRSTALTRLCAISKQDLQTESVDAWLAWWDHARADCPEQFVGAEPPPRLQLHARGRGADLPAPLALGDQSVVLIGRDPKCHVRLADPAVSRLHATLFRLHRRVVIRDEGSAAGTRHNGEPVRYAFFDPGDAVAIGDVELRLEDDTPPAAKRPASPFEVDAFTFARLIEAKHPAVASALVGLIEEASRLTWIHDVALELFPRDAARQAAFGDGLRARYAQAARHGYALLPLLLGEDCGADAAAWSSLLAKQLSTLPLQVALGGWLR